MSEIVNRARNIATAIDNAVVSDMQDLAEEVVFAYSNIGKVAVLTTYVTSYVNDQKKLGMFQRALENLAE